MATEKQKKQQRIAIGIIVGVILLALLIKYGLRPKDTTNATSSSGSGSSGSGSSGLASLGSNTTLKRGSKGQEVQWVQYAYNKYRATPLGTTKLAQDGVFGPKTEAAVKSVTGSTSTTWTKFQGIVTGSTSIASNSNPSGYDNNSYGQYYYSGPEEYSWESNP